MVTEADNDMISVTELFRQVAGELDILEEVVNANGSGTIDPAKNILLKAASLGEVAVVEYLLDTGFHVSDDYITVMRDKNFAQEGVSSDSIDMAIELVQAALPGADDK